MLAHGARCSIGDHLHPTGRIDQSTMGVIAPAYKWVAEREAWAEGTTNRAEIALLSRRGSEQAAALSGVPGHHAGPDEGAVRVLLEGKFTFDVVDLDSDYSQYRLLILPDAIAVDGSLKAKVETLRRRAAARCCSPARAASTPRSGFVFDVGAEWNGTSHNEGGDYLLPVASLRADFVDDPLFMYQPAEQIRLTDGTSLGEVYEPYFDRTPRHFSGHVNTASQPDASAHSPPVRARATSPISPSRSFPATSRPVRSRCWRSPRS